MLLWYVLNLKTKTKNFRIKLVLFLFLSQWSFRCMQLIWLDFHRTVDLLLLQKTKFMGEVHKKYIYTLWLLIDYLWFDEVKADFTGYLLSAGVGGPRLVLIPLAAQTTRRGSRWSVSKEGEISCRKSSRRFDRTCRKSHRKNIRSTVVGSKQFYMWQKLKSNLLNSCDAYQCNALTRLEEGYDQIKFGNFHCIWLVNLEVCCERENYC